MKKCIIPVLLFFCVIGTKAQFEFDLKFDKVDVYGSASETELVAYGYIINSSGQNEIFNWNISKNVPGSWKIFVVNGDSTYDSTATSGSIPILDGDSSAIEIHVFPNGKPANGKITVATSRQSDPFDLVEFPVTFHVWALSIPENPFGSDIQTYPNPVSDILIISTDKEKAMDIEVYDINGKLLLTHLHAGKVSKLNVGNLPAGTYFLRYNDKGNTVVKKVEKAY